MLQRPSRQRLSSNAHGAGDLAWQENSLRQGFVDRTSAVAGFALLTCPQPLPVEGRGL